MHGSFRPVAPKASVMVTTYNHERFVAQAIEGALNQKTSFTYEIVIGEDCSTDGTREIVACYQRRHPDIIRPLYQPRNRGMNRNVIDTFLACRGEYIAFVEGDDYWISPQKLQRQVDFLDANRDCALCFHPARVVRDDKLSESILPETIPTILRLEDMLRENPIPTCSAMFRRALAPEPPEWIQKLQMVDWPLFALVMQHGHAACLPEVMSAYRMHGNGLWTQKTQRLRAHATVEALLRMNDHFGGSYWPVVRRQLSRIYAGITYQSEQENLLTEAVWANWKAIAVFPPNIRRYGPNLLRLLLKTSMPRLYRSLKRKTA